MCRRKRTGPELVEVEKHYRRRTRLVTDKLPEDLPIEVVEHELPEAFKHVHRPASGK